jgi:polysaccharide pyruvyl transferase WcaK-like protein
VGVREAASHAVALRLGVDPGRLHQGADDASFLGLAADGLPALEPTVLVSLSTHVGASDRDGFLDSVAALLDELASHSGLVTSFLAHFGPLAEPWRRGDVVMHEEVAARMSSATRTVATGTSVAAAQAARAAQLVVTSRYHPAVFATSAGTPTVGIAVDDYTTVKLTGALRNLGQDAVIDAEQLLAGASAVPVWERREAIRARGLVVAGERQRESSAWWDRLFGALRP